MAGTAQGGRVAWTSQAGHRRWLHVSAVVIAAFGPVFWLGTMPATDGPARLTLDLLSWPVDGGTAWDSPDVRFLAALTGGFLIGWGVMVWMLARLVHPLAPEPVRRAMVLSALAWFAVDSSGSILSGNPSNALFNLVVLFVVVGPMWRPAQG